ncbi:helix-turn-helix transcriptional regulator [Pontibacter flavimaris]|uniref:helix-turn-helix transcriptional regulator n=1 Tax=Pontibacter flavimaris TaxID=1797110 RepID=UPI0009390730|nr:WYL domain-containing protein [Pontibacter flavimaris]
MARNKHAVIRYKVLDRCFRNPGRRYFIQDLIDECNKVLLEIDPDSKGISRRQIFEDIAFMESSEGYSIELHKHRESKRVYYRYVDISFSIDNSPLNEVEINQLRNAMTILAQFKGMPQFEYVHEILAKLNQGIALKQEEDVIIDFDNNLYLKGIELLGELHNAILYKKVLCVSYQPFENDAPYDVMIHPYYLKQYNNRWFLFGYNPDEGFYNWNLALDRIVSITETDGKYHPNTEIDWFEYFDEMIGVTKPVGATTEPVVLHLNGRAGKYVINKPIHGSQHDKWLAPDLLEVKLDLVINFEFKRLILSYGKDVEVISPEWLKEETMGNLKAALDQYQPVAKTEGA